MRAFRVLIDLDDENNRSREQVADHLVWISERVRAGAWNGESESSWWNVRHVSKKGGES